MLNVKNLADVHALIEKRFGSYRTDAEKISIDNALNRVLAVDVAASEYVPAFNRSTVDGYAVKSSDIFGCSDAIPAILKLVGEAIMGKHTEMNLDQGQCVSVPTGGEVPDGADAVVMLEDAENFGDGTIGVRKPCTPGTNLIFRGDDVKPGGLVYSKGKKLDGKDIGTLAALGFAYIPLMKYPRVTIISSGDELVGTDTVLQMGMIRDVNGPMLKASVLECGAQPKFHGIVKDDKSIIKDVILQTITDCDILVLTGGTSAGVKDAIPEAIAELGELLVHGVAAKPGKPTVLGQINGMPVFGLPGNPLAAYFMFLLLVKPLIFSMLGTVPTDRRKILPLSHAVSSNHGREDLVPAFIKDDTAHPIIGKSGLITTLTSASGYIRIARDCEGLKKGELVEVILFEE
jgi:molybdopterin molybdotransferase